MNPNVIKIDPDMLPISNSTNCYYHPLYAKLINSLILIDSYKMRNNPLPRKVLRNAK